MTVTLPFVPFREPLDWAKEHCPSYITNDMHQNENKSWDHTKIDFFFGDEKDAMMFILKWS